MLEVEIFKKLSDHVFGILNNKLIVWPKKLSSRNCNPKTIHALKISENNRDVVIIDRIKSKTPKVNICGHVNRSGENYLIGRTPHDKFPQFPDMTNIYLTHPSRENKIVHTLGPKRFKGSTLNGKTIWSEAAGLVVPVFHYIGFNIKGIGLNSTKSFKQLF